MEYVAAGDLDRDGVHMLSTGGMQRYAEQAAPGSRGDRRDRGRDALPAAPRGARACEFIPANAEASCRFMKMITLPKLRDALRDGIHEVRVPARDRRRGAPRDRADGRDRRVAPAEPAGILSRPQAPSRRRRP